MRRVSLLGFLLLVLATGSAMADVIDINAPQITHSWAQQWSENGILGGIMQPYNTVVITMNTGTMEFLTASTPGWIVTDQTTTMSLTSSQTGPFDFATTFVGTWATPISFTYQVYLDTALLSTQILSWDPATMTWSFAYPNNCVVPVPEADLALLLLTGIAFTAMLAAFTKA